MLRQTSLLQCCHFSSLPSVSCVLGQPILLPSPTKLTLSHPMFPVRDPELHSDASLCPTQWPRMASTFHLTPGNLLTKDFCFSFPSFFGFVDFFPLFLSFFSNSPSFSVCILFIFLLSYPVKWPYQVPRYVSDAAPHVPTLRFGKEMSTKSRLQGRPSSSSTFFPVLDNLSPIGVNSLFCSVPSFLLFVLLVL